MWVGFERAKNKSEVPSKIIKKGRSLSSQSHEDDSLLRHVDIVILVLLEEGMEPLLESQVGLVLSVVAEAQDDLDDMTARELSVALGRALSESLLDLGNVVEESQRGIIVGQVVQVYLLVLVSVIVGDGQDHLVLSKKIRYEKEWYLCNAFFTVASKSATYPDK